MKKDFDKFINSLKYSIFTWSYFVDFEKVKNNVHKIERELNLLNTLIGKDNVEKELLSLVREYPKVRKVLPILIAIRKDKLNSMEIITDELELNSEKKKEVFFGELTKKNEKELVDFFRKSGLEKVFKNKNIKSVYDYVFGVEVGMDTNARKNRTGKLMEDLVENFVKDFCHENNFEYLPQATKSKIKEKFGIDIKMQEKLKNKNGERKFDFAIFNKNKKKLTVIEVNYYSSTGSKPSSISREYIDLEKIFKKEGVDFVWVTDGMGWESMKNPLKKTIDENDYVVNLENLKNGIFDDIIK